ncbi:carbohydrate-binding module family 48 protein [Sporormia fimetaria CBS 119925]|uniref:Carbohydrate-binding module family 48 protein n=1 Tax=Sporormia fimetaria CBS 119925 TaxID=1340428 RepID=A0A6A6V4H9_9PLEO|nr:carbohydrate-binding module family 48 protein [Sporormia fimetaria CBS 119925]
MGNEQSRTHDKGSKESKASKARSTPSSSEKPSPALPSQSQPVDVPAPRDDPPPAPPKIDAPFSPSSPLPVEYFVPPAQFARPPRLPLPIEEEVHTPGSPIISPEELVDPDGTLPRRTSLSSTVADEDEDEGDELSAPQNGPTVPTLIEWEGRGEKVYVTGTFVNWERKFRLYKNGPSKKKDVLSAIVNITPGTHHLKFLVDGEMTASDKLPTAVDYTNILVNYLEVSLDHLTKPPADAKDATSQPEPTPLFPAPPKQTGDSAQPAPTPPLSKYHSVIPRYLRDLDSDENSSRYQRASAVTNEPEALPAPPTLPMFLNKSILNGATPMKDDSSVLNLPNHTVLNHLATSSIKDNILATSATTRYKQKVCSS